MKRLKERNRRMAEENKKENTQKKDVDIDVPVVDNQNEEETEKASEDKSFEEKDLAAEIEKAKADAAEANDKYLRLFAEFDNYRKRTTKEKTECYNDATVKCVEQILPVMDAFDIALKAPCQDEKFFKGMEMILNQFVAILGKMNVVEIKALGEKFDPNIHHAIKQAESDDMESDTVCEVFQKGYMLGERLIRPAMVAVVS